MQSSVQQRLTYIYHMAVGNDRVSGGGCLLYVCMWSLCCILHTILHVTALYTCLIQPRITNVMTARHILGRRRQQLLQVCEVHCRFLLLLSSLVHAEMPVGVCMHTHCGCGSRQRRVQGWAGLCV